jgi:branched-chain amino acid aminotransferase
LLGFELPYSVDELERMKEELITKNGFGAGYVRLIAWVEPPFRPKQKLSDGVRIAAAVWDWGSYYASKDVGVRLTFASWRRPHPKSSPYESKAAGPYAIGTLVKHDAERAGFGDGLMLDWQGFVAEATSSNIFFVLGDELHTPIADCFLNGITRQTVLALARRRGIQAYERHILPGEIETFNDCFLTGTAAEISRVACIDHQDFRLSAITGSLMDDYGQLVAGKLLL